MNPSNSKISGLPGPAFLAKAVAAGAAVLVAVAVAAGVGEFGDVPLNPAAAQAETAVAHSSPFGSD